jgi:sphingosine kinase
MMASTAIGFIPGGSANGLVKAVLDFSGEEYSIENAAFLCAKGRTTRMDLTEIETEYEKHKIYSFLSTFWGVIADCDINSEVLRWMGSARFTVWGAYRVLCPVNYLGSIIFTGQKVGNKQDVDNLDE